MENTGEQVVIKSENILPKKILFFLILIFSMCSLKLCAEDMSPAQAQVARETFVAEAKKYVGSPYVLGATGPDTFDCSGLVYFVAREALNKQLPRTARAIYNYCKIVPADKREIGDLLFFKTNNSAPITHVGIYIGNNQFISAISDGPNTGVIISSLNQDYWKPKYVATGKFIAEGIPGEDDADGGAGAGSGGVLAGGGRKSSFKGSSYYNPNGKFTETFLESLVIDGSIFADWSLFKPNQFMINFRGVDIMANIRMANVILEPGLGLSLRINTGMKIFQIPLVLSITLNDYVRFYAGPVFSIGKAKMVGTEERVKPSIFPGILGVSFSTPAFHIGPAAIQFVQDISYTVFNNIDNSALPFKEAASAGLVFYTGARVTFGKRTRK